MATSKKSAKKASKKTTRKPAATKKSTAKKTALKNNTTRKTDPVVHFELPAEDRKRMSKFYAAAFGWKMQDLGPDMGNYVLANTAGELDKKTGRPKERGIINGGFYEKNNDWPAQYPSVVIAVPNLKKGMQKVTKAGGQVIGDPIPIPGFGTYVSFYDTEGNRLSIIEPAEM